MRADLKGGKTVIVLHETDKRALNKARDILRFVERNSSDTALNKDANCGAGAIDSAMGKMCAETPENDTGTAVESQPPAKPDTQLAKSKVA